MLALQILRWTAARCVQSCCTTKPTFLNVETTLTLCPPGSWKVAGASMGVAVGGCISIPLVLAKLIVKPHSRAVSCSMPAAACSVGREGYSKAWSSAQS
eukprot:54314-Chlamydomonas_euryale.AAC.1